MCSRAQEVVPVAPTPIEVEAYDSDHKTSDQVTTKPRGMTRMRTTSEWYVILSWKSCCWTTMNLRAMEKRWWPVFRQMVRSHEIRDSIHISEQSMDFDGLAR